MFNLGAIELAIIFLLTLGISLVPTIFFCLTLQKCLSRCSPQNRAMTPGLVWLLLIPLFNLVWQFFVVLNVSSSLASEFRLRNMSREPAPGKPIGLAFCILVVCTIIPIIGFLAAIAGLVCWILYWVKIAGYSAEIADPFAAAGDNAVA